jgi:2-haloacid dehalogenase
MTTTVVFDLGGVLVDWNPRYLYRSLIDDEREVERFLATVCTQSWNEQQDAGRPFAEAVAELVGRFPEQADLIRAYDERWPEMIRGSLPDTVDILAELRDRGTRLLALTNWSAEKFHVARERFEFLTWFEGIVVSGEENMRKPDTRIYRLLVDRYRVTTDTAVFIDDSAANVAASKDAGLPAIQFESAAALRRALTDRGAL